jgi:hypothetical protein
MPIALAKLVRNRSQSLFFNEFLVLFAYCDGYHVFLLKWREGSSSENRCELGDGKEARSGLLGICPRVHCVCLR